MQPNLPHLYILFLSTEEYCHIISEHNYSRDITFEFRIHRYYQQQLDAMVSQGSSPTRRRHRSWRIVKCGCRLVHKQDVKDIYRNHF